MKLDKLNPWVSLIANLSVLIGLIVLVYEIRQNRLQLRSQASYSINEGISLLNSAIYRDAVLAEIVRKGEMDFHSLDSTELSQFVAFQFDRLNMAIHIRTLENEGVSNIHFPYIEYIVSDYKSKPGLQDFLVSIEETWIGPKEIYYLLQEESE